MPDTIFDNFVPTIRYCGHDLHRPESIVAGTDGTLWVSDSRGGVTEIDMFQNQRTIGVIPGTPNGIAMERDGSLLVAEIDHGIVYRLSRSGAHEVVLDRFQGAPLGAVNFVYVDGRGAIWITVSTRLSPRSKAIERPVPDGYILRLDPAGPRVMKTGLHFPNELRIDRRAAFVYVVESSLGRGLRMPLQPDGSLGRAETFGSAPIFDGAIVDGIAFDSHDGLWVTEVTRNGLFRIAKDGSCQKIFENPEGDILQFPASITFGGADLRTAYIGSIRMNRLATFQCPVAGAPLAHWLS